jgi:hypothetical protein
VRGLQMAAVWRPIGVSLSQFRVLWGPQKMRPPSIGRSGRPRYRNFLSTGAARIGIRPLGRRVLGKASEDDVCRVLVRLYVQNERRASACSPRGTLGNHERATWQSYFLSEFVRSGRAVVNHNAQHETPPKKNERSFSMENYRSTFAGGGSLPRPRILRVL